MGHYTVDRAFRSRQRMYGILMEPPESSAARPLSVSGICSAAGVSRTTFYRHFADVDDFLSRFLDDAIADATAGIPAKLSLFQALIIQCGALEEEAGLRSLVVNPDLRKRVERISRERTERHFNIILESAACVQDNDLRFMAGAVSSCLPPLLLEWAEQAHAIPAARFAAHAVSVVSDQLLAVAGNAFL